MTSATDSLLQHLLTRSDLARLQVPSAQVEQWLTDGRLEAVATLSGGEGDAVMSVADAALRSELGARLAAAGKSTVLLCPERIRSFLQRAAASEEAAKVADELTDGDLTQMLATAIAELDGDLEVVARLAEEEAALQATPADDGNAVEQGIDTAAAEVELLYEPFAIGKSATKSEWFEAGELEAAMGKLASRSIGAETEEVAATTTGELDDLVPLLHEDFEELAASVAFHSEQLERLVDLPHTVEELTQELEQLRAAVQSGGVLATMSDSSFDGRRTSLMAIGLAMLCWSGLIWFGTGSATLALVSFVAANVIGCLALQPARRG